MKSNYALAAVTAVAFLFSVVSIGVTLGHQQNISEVEGGLFAAVIAVIILAVRLCQVEKRLSRLESPDKDGNSPEKEEEKD